MESTAIVTDSTADLPIYAVLESGITVIPLTVNHRDKSYLDGIDISPSEFYPMLRSSEDLPTTSQPAPSQFQEAYRRALQSASNVISIHLSGDLSGTCDVARAAATEVDADHIHVVDSRSISYGMGMQVMEAVRLARAGLKAVDILEYLSRLKTRIDLIFTLDTLHYVHKGGRIGLASALLGQILGIKPVLRIDDGHLLPLTRCRGVKSAIRTVSDIVKEKYGGVEVRLAVGHAAAPERVDALMNLLVPTLNIKGDVYTCEIGPVIGVHAGPGAAGVAVMPVVY